MYVCLSKYDINVNTHTTVLNISERFQVLRKLLVEAAIRANTEGPLGCGLLWC